jgi:enoyl-CoA hydratase/carnithine racemase
VIHVEAVDGVRWLRLESGKVQALDLELTTALTDEILRAVAEGTPPLVVTGTGSSFSAGVDLFRVRKKVRTMSRASCRRWARHWLRSSATNGR